MPETTAHDPWITAEDAADLHRYQRLHPTALTLFADRWLRPLIVVLLVLDSAALLSAPWLPNGLRETIGSAAIGGILLGAGVAFVWAFQTNRLSAAGTPNIGPTLPTGMYPAVRRQIYGDEALDPEHRDVITETAYQQRAQQQGHLALLTYLVPMYLDLGTRPDPVGPVFLIVGAIVLATAAITGVRTNRRLTRCIDRLERL